MNWKLQLDMDLIELEASIGYGFDRIGYGFDKIGSFSRMPITDWMFENYFEFISTFFNLILFVLSSF